MRGLRLGLGLGLSRSAGFSPLALFTAGEQGFIYDPSDFTTLFQDPAGTTPVTAVGQTVGLVLDKSKGLVLGPELVTNGDFSGGSTGWTLGGWVISSGQATATATNTSLYGGQFTPVANRVYRVEFDVVSYTSGALSITVGGNFTTSVNLTGAAMAPGRKSVLVVAGSSPARAVEFYGGSITAVIDNISVRELPGNHATQSVLASRPILAREPLGGRRNLLTYTEQFDNAAWSKSNATITANSTAAPDGTMTADTLVEDAATATHLMSQTQTLSATPYTASVYLKAMERGFALFSQGTVNGISVNLSTGAVASAVGSPTNIASTNAGNGWWRVSFTFTPSAGSTTLNIYASTDGVWANRSYAGSTSSGIFVWGTQLEAVPDANLVLGSELVTNGDFSGGSTGWTVRTGWAIGSGVATATAANASLLSTSAVTAGKVYRVAFDVTSYTSGTLYVRVGTGTAITVTGSGSKVLYLTATNTSGVEFYGGSITLSIDNISVREITGTTGMPTDYQRVTSTYDVTEAGKADLHYLLFDGSDDFLVTPTITPGTDKAQVFAGVRKLSDTLRGAVLGFSSAPNVNNGSFEMFAPGQDAEASYGISSRGTSLASTRGTTFAAPITNVVTGLGDISAPSVILRVNGTQVAFSTGTQGTGNYLAYPLYIGRRGGTTLPFNGRLYGLIARFGPNLSDVQIAQTEQWLNQKTGAF